MLAPGYSIVTIDGYLDGTPFSISTFVEWSISQAIHGAEIRYNAFVCARQIIETFDFIEHAAAGIRHFFHAIITHVESFRLRILRVERFIVRV